MNWKLKCISLMLTFMLVIGTISGCSSKGENKEPDKKIETTVQATVKVPDYLNPTGFPIVKQPITITMMGSKHVTHGEWKDMMIFQEYEKKTNIHIEFTTVPDNAFSERKNIALASGSLPDVFYRGALSQSDEVNYGTQGVLIPLNDLINNYAPNIKTMFDKFPEVRKGISAPDGKIYSLPQVVDYLAPRINVKPWINKKWLDKLNLSLPTTTDEYYKVLKAFKDGDPNGNGKKDEIPWSGDKSFPIWQALRGAWGIGTTGGKIANFDLDSNNKFRFYPVDVRYKEMLEYCSMLYKEGLIDRDVFTQQLSQFMAKGNEGVIGSFHSSNTAIIGAKYPDDFVSLPALKGPHGDQIYSQVLPTIQMQGTFAITNKNKYPEATIRWVEYFYSEEGSKFFRMGIEGKTYEILPNGEIQYKDEIRNNPKGLSFDQSVGQFTPWPGGGLPHMIFEKFDKTGNSLPSSLASAKLLAPYIPKEIWPNFLFTKDEQSRLNALGSDINSYVNEMMVKFVTGAEPFSAWDNYVNTLKKMNVDEFTNIYKVAYERWKKN